MDIGDILQTRHDIINLDIRDEAKCSGFTLLELVLATFISALVIGILSVALSFSLRLWERQQSLRESDAPRVIELLRWQVANFNPVPFEVEGAEQIIFSGSEMTLALATNYSVRAISQGVPVVARYIFDARNKILYYSEIPLNPYDPDVLDEFLKMSPTEKDRAWPPFFATEVEQFSLLYQAENGGALTEEWEDPDTTPVAMYVNWKMIESPTPMTTILFPNAFFRELMPFESESALPELGED
jgi:hypothetical protein